MKQSMQDSFEKSKSKVKLNVGGTVFTTSKSNLTSVKDSFFSYMLSNDKWKPDEDGEYFIDRDPKYFELILHQHRYGECDYSHLSDFEKNMFNVDIDFYGVGSLFPELNIGNVKEEGEMININRGILEWIGSREGTSVWENPFSVGLVDIKSSTPDNYRELNRDEGYSEFVKNNVIGKSFGSTNDPNQWIYVDLKNYLVIPSSYRLCNTRIGKDCHPRNWTLDASKNGQSWKVLSEHKGDGTLNDKCKIGTWNIDDDSKEKYRYFRIRQFGYSSGTYNHLSCCCFEIYGIVNKIS